MVRKITQTCYDAGYFLMLAGGGLFVFGTWHCRGDCIISYEFQKFGEGTDFDLDYGKLLLSALCIYIAVKVS